jgi:hypothetical protein
MLNNNKRFSISPKMLKYLRDSTNKFLEKYLNKYSTNKYNTNVLILKDKRPSHIVLLPFVSFISFLAGYIAGYNLKLLVSK